MQFITPPIIIVLLLMGCKPKSENETTGNLINDTMISDTIRSQDAFIYNTQDSIYQKGIIIVTMNDCANCHKINEKLVGPSFNDVATKYSGGSKLTIDTLARKVIEGGTGQWGEATMTPHSNLSLLDARAAVKYILLLRK